MTVMEKGSAYQKLHAKVAGDVGIKFETLESDKCADKFPYLHFKDSDVAWFESTGAGYVNPREFVRAEQTLAIKKGCEIIDDVVACIIEENGLRKLMLSGSSPIYARKVLLATGAFTEFFQLLPDDVKPDVAIVSNTVVLAELSRKDETKMRYTKVLNTHIYIYEQYVALMGLQYSVHFLVQAITNELRNVLGICHR